MLWIILIALGLIIMALKVNEHERHKRYLQEKVEHHIEEHKKLGIKPYPDGTLRDEPLVCKICKKAWDHHFEPKDLKHEDLENDIQDLRDELGL